jgi:hypothetical protein
MSISKYPFQTKLRLANWITSSRILCLLFVLARPKIAERQWRNIRQNRCDIFNFDVTMAHGACLSRSLHIYAGPLTQR